VIRTLKLFFINDILVIQQMLFFVQR